MVVGMRTTSSVVLLIALGAMPASAADKPSPPELDAPALAPGTARSHLHDVRTLGAVGDGEHPIEDSRAFEAAIRALPRNAEGDIVGGTIAIPMGRYALASPLELRNCSGVTILGAGRTTSELLPVGPAFADRAVVRLVNCKDVTIRDLRIGGSLGAPASAAIESVVDAPRSDKGFPTNLEVRSVTLGSLDAGSDYATHPERVGLRTGIRFSAAPDWDGNNDQSVIDNVTIGGFSEAGIAIDHSQSLLHRISNCRIGGGPVAVRLRGGSFQMSHSILFVSEWDFRFEDPVGTLRGKSSAGYFHTSFVSDTSTESNAGILTTTDWPRGAKPEDGQTGIDVSFRGFGKKGTGKVALDYRSSGHVSFEGSTLNFGAGSSFSVRDPRAHVTLRDSRINGLGRIWLAGRLSSAGNQFVGAAPVVEKPASGLLLQTGDVIDAAGRTDKMRVIDVPPAR